MLLPALLISSNLYAVNDNTKYLCIQNQVTGFKNTKNPWTDDGIWTQANFTTENKYIIRRVTKDIKWDNKNWKRFEGTYIVSTFGSNSMTYFCTENHSGNTKHFDCTSDLGFFSFDSSRNRFIMAYKGGYLKNTKNDTPILEIGTCSPI